MESEGIPRTRSVFHLYLRNRLEAGGRRPYLLSYSLRLPASSLFYSVSRETVKRISMIFWTSARSSLRIWNLGVSSNQLRK